MGSGFIAELQAIKQLMQNMGNYAIGKLKISLSFPPRRVVKDEVGRKAASGCLEIKFHYAVLLRFPSTN